VCLLFCSRSVVRSPLNTSCPSLTRTGGHPPTLGVGVSAVLQSVSSLESPEHFLSVTHKNRWPLGCPNILNFTSTSNITGGILYRYILSPNPKFQNFISRIDRLPAFSVNCKIYIVKRHENGQKIIIFSKMGITFD